MGVGGGDTGGYMTTGPSPPVTNTLRSFSGGPSSPFLWGQGALAQETGQTALQVGAQSRGTSKGSEPALDLPAKGGPSPGVFRAWTPSPTD